jgi:hypothetical protein
MTLATGAATKPNSNTRQLVLKASRGSALDSTLPQRKHLPTPLSEANASLLVMLGLAALAASIFALAVGVYRSVASYRATRAIRRALERKHSRVRLVLFLYKLLDMR